MFHIPDVSAGVVTDFSFDNRRYRIPPAAARSIDRAQMFALEAAGQALEQAGLASDLDFGNRTAVIFGTISGEKSVENVLRTRIPAVRRALESSSAADDDPMDCIKSTPSMSSPGSIPR